MNVHSLAENISLIDYAVVAGDRQSLIRLVDNSDVRMLVDDVGNHFHALILCTVVDDDQFEVFVF